MRVPLRFQRPPRRSGCTPRVDRDEVLGDTAEGGGHRAHLSLSREPCYEQAVAVRVAPLPLVGGRRQQHRVRRRSGDNRAILGQCWMLQCYELLWVVAGCKSQVARSAGLVGRVVCPLEDRTMCKPIAANCIVDTRAALPAPPPPRPHGGTPSPGAEQRRGQWVVPGQGLTWLTPKK
jgi:hypothetical protein